jgi:uncharacterized membrane protein
MIRRDALLEYSRGSLWLLPIVAVVVSVALGAVLSQIVVGPDSPLAFQGTADDARSLLIAVTSTMVTVIALLLGLAVVALQLSSTQFSPRLLRNFLRDRPNQVVLSVFVGTFGYSAAGLFEVGVSRGERVAEFPRFAVTVAIGLLFVSLALLVFFADHLAHSIQVDHIMRVAERATLRVISELPVSVEAAPAVPADAMTITAGSSGYVQVVYVEELLAAAHAGRVNIRLRPRVGEHVVAGSTLAWSWPASPDGPAPPAAGVAATLDRAVRIGFERTLEQDPGLGMRQLCDAACKALSPAINDPYTAIQAIEHLSVLYAALAARPIGDLVIRDPSHMIVVAVPARSFSEHLALGVGLIRRYGAKEPTVVAALLRLTATALAATGTEPDRWAAIEEQANLLVTAAERQIVEPADLTFVHAERTALERLLEVRRAGSRE